MATVSRTSAVSACYYKFRMYDACRNRQQFAAKTQAWLRGYDTNSVTKSATLIVRAMDKWHTDPRYIELLKKLGLPQ